MSDSAASADLVRRDVLVRLSERVSQGQLTSNGPGARKVIGAWPFAQQLVAYDALKAQFNVNEVRYPKVMAATDIVRASAKRLSAEACLQGLAEFAATNPVDLIEVTHTILGTSRNWIDGLFDSPHLMGLTRDAYDGLRGHDEQRSWQGYVESQLRDPHYDMTSNQRELVRALITDWHGTAHSLVETVRGLDAA